MGEVVPARTSPTLPPPLCCSYPVSKCPSASIVVTSTLRAKTALVLCKHYAISVTIQVYILHPHTILLHDILQTATIHVFLWEPLKTHTDCYASNIYCWSVVDHAVTVCTCTAFWWQKPNFWLVTGWMLRASEMLLWCMFVLCLLLLEHWHNGLYTLLTVIGKLA